MKRSYVIEYPATYMCTTCNYIGMDIWTHRKNIGDIVEGCPDMEEQCERAFCVVVATGTPQVARDGNGNPVRV